MSNTTILDVTSSSSNVTGDVTNMDGGQLICHIMATSYGGGGGNGKIVLKGSSDGSTYTTLNDPNQTSPSSGKAEYDADTIVVIDKLPQGWKLRADLEISSGTATGVAVVVSSN